MCQTLYYLALPTLSHLILYLKKKKKKKKKDGKDRYYYIISILKMKTWGLKRLINWLKVTSYQLAEVGFKHRQFVGPRGSVHPLRHIKRHPRWAHSEGYSFELFSPTVLTSYFEPSPFSNVVIFPCENFSVGVLYIQPPNLNSDT